MFPCATGDENYIGGAVETIEAIRLIKEKIPYVKTVLGISNISFGLAGLSARSGQLGLPVLLHQGRPRSRHRQCRKAGALRVDSRQRNDAWLSICSSTRRRPTFRRIIRMRLLEAAARRLAAANARAEDRRSINSTSPPLPSTSARRDKKEKKKSGGPAARRTAGQLHH